MPECLRTVYYGPQGGALLAFSVTSARLSSSLISQTSTQFEHPGTSVKES